MLQVSVPTLALPGSWAMAGATAMASAIAAPAIEKPLSVAFFIRVLSSTRSNGPSTRSKVTSSRPRSSQADLGGLVSPSVLRELIVLGFKRNALSANSGSQIDTAR